MNNKDKTKEKNNIKDTQDKQNKFATDKSTSILDDNHEFLILPDENSEESEKDVDFPDKFSFLKRELNDIYDQIKKKKIDSFIKLKKIQNQINDLKHYFNLLKSFYSLDSTLSEDNEDLNDDSNNFLNSFFDKESTQCILDVKKLFHQIDDEIKIIYTDLITKLEENFNKKNAEISAEIMDIDSKYKKTENLISENNERINQVEEKNKLHNKESEEKIYKTIENTQGRYLQIVALLISIVSIIISTFGKGDLIDMKTVVIANLSVLVSIDFLFLLIKSVNYQHNSNKDDINASNNKKNKLFSCFTLPNIIVLLQIIVIPLFLFVIMYVADLIKGWW